MNEEEKKVTVLSYTRGANNTYKEGTFTPGMTTAEVAPYLRGSWGGIFTLFDTIKGVFSFTAYRD